MNKNRRGEHVEPERGRAREELNEVEKRREIEQRGQAVMCMDWILCYAALKLLLSFSLTSPRSQNQKQRGSSKTLPRLPVPV